MNEAKEGIKLLIDKYQTAKEQGKINKYTEEETKNSFIKPLFEALGWDFSEKEEVSAEEHVSLSGRLDYGFYINGRPKFYLEVKKLKADLNNEEFARQAIKYSFNKGVTWAVLTDFEGIKIFNAQSPSKYLGDKLYFELKYFEYLDRFDKLWELSKESFQTDLIDQRAIEAGKKLQKVPITELLSKDLNECRKLLTEKLGEWNPGVPQELLDEGVQKLLDRIVFIKVAEDRKIEQNVFLPLINQWRLLTGSNKPTLYQSMTKKFRELDDIYNSNLFEKHAFEAWEESGEVLEEVLDILNGKKGYYEFDFSVMSADTLGSVYENYLGYKLSQSQKGLTLHKDAGKRKEQGIYYTPPFIVDYIVRNALKPVLDKCRSVNDLKKIKVLDPACGSGSFLIKVLEIINEKYKEFGNAGDELTKIQILQENIYGVDLDEQAVEIARLNLLINALEKRAKLPLLDKNIINRNSLISGVDEDLRKFFGSNYKDKKPINWKEEFPQIFKQGGFDVIIGNPPYIDSESMSKNAPEERDFITNNYASAKGNWDLYIPFWELAKKLLKPNGIASYITPNKWISIKYGETLRKEFYDCIFKVCNCKDVKVFAAGNSPIIAFIKKGLKEEKIVLDKFDLNFNVQQNGDVSKGIINIDKWGVLLSGNIDLIKKLMKNKNKIADYLSIENPFTVGEAYELKKILEESTKDKNNSFRFVNTGTIDRYISLWGQQKTTYLKDYYNKPILAKDKFMQAFPKRYKQMSTSKIIISGMRNFECLLDNNGEMIAGKSTIIAKPRERKCNLLFFLAILNSKLIRFYINEIYSALGIDGGINFTSDLVGDLPLANFDKDLQTKISLFAKNMIALNTSINNYDSNSNKWNSIKTEIEKTDKKIDEVVYKLYGLTPEEIKIVENS